MAQVKVTIAGREYRVACDEGEEERLGELTQIVDARIQGMRERFGEIGDQRLTVMAAITLADEMTEIKRRLGVLEAELSARRAAEARPANRQDEWTGRLALTLEEAALRIEDVAKALNKRS
ncbi:cell division protein ZapA [Methylocapsa palsarum]|uniref:Cell division protein ZapA n=1 Tax=Methylocapsa palsarum TaxID=1612308 RepID=A0A1I3XV55_9HYPH|nr:cell division protein ZapA [Methylocapsa palsarum]SFK23448.1 cell division protein ZapA [Methylocapsa palsarum]